jgi:hypothetical protein
MGGAPYPRAGQVTWVEPTQAGPHDPAAVAKRRWYEA